MPYPINPFTGKLDETTDISGLEPKGIDLHLDQTTPQKVINGAPQFNGGLIIKAGQKLIMDGV